MLSDPDVVEFADGTSGRTADGVAAKVRLLGELRHAIDRGRLDMVYQPKLALDTGRVVGVEALLRWPHPQLGILRPDAFMSLVRPHGLMRPVTDLVLNKVLDDAARWIALGVQVPIAVNLFAPFLRDTRLPETLFRAMDGHPGDRGVAAPPRTRHQGRDRRLRQRLLGPVLPSRPAHRRSEDGS